MRVSQNLTERELEVKIRELRQWYIPIDLNSRYNRKKIQSVKKLNAILDGVSRQDLQKANIEEIVRCALTIIYYFSMRLKVSRSTSKLFSRWCSKRQFLKAEAVFQKTMDKLLPERSEATTAIMLAFFTDAALWPLENFVGEVLEIVMYCTPQPITVLDMILKEVHCELISDLEDKTFARHRIKVLYDLLRSEYFKFDTQELIYIIKRLLNYITTDEVNGNNKSILNLDLKRALEICLRRIFERVSNHERLAIITTMLNMYSTLDNEEEELLQFSIIFQYAAGLYEVGLLSNCLPDDVMALVLDSFVGSASSLRSLVGCRFIQHFLDRKLNAQYLLEPKLYYKATETQLNNHQCNHNDKEFIRRHEEKLHEYFILAITTHCDKHINLSAVYTVVCCMVLEVPCGMTAASAAFMMKIVQDFALQEENISLRSKHWMHAIVISVMSLICWVHKAPFLWQYVNQIMTLRAKEAPQLNPPLLQEYTVRTSNPWSNTALFLKEWELRYGLWKAFALSPVK